MRHLKRQFTCILLTLPLLTGCQPLEDLGKLVDDLLKRFTGETLRRPETFARFVHIPALLMALAAMLTGCALATKAPPVANAGPDVTVQVGQEVSLDGSSSVDLDGGKIAYYHWSIRAAPEGRQDEVGRVLGEGQDSVCSTDLPLNSENHGQWTIELRATDDEGQSATDEMMLTVLP